MNTVNPEAFEYLLGKITDGNVFEKFAKDLLGEVVGLDFIPMGGMHDRGLDGLDSTYRTEKEPSTVYQISIQADPKVKIKRTIAALHKNGISCNRMIYVTNRVIGDKDKLISEIYQEFNLNVLPWDSEWLRGKVNKSEGCIRIYSDFVERNTHAFNQAGKQLLVTDFVNDPRVFVFLRQQLDSYGADAKLDELLVDSLILYALEGTDPDKGLFKTREEILEAISSLTSFDTSKVRGLLDDRLNLLYKTKPRKIRFHVKDQKYCLPFETRLELEQQQIVDYALFEAYRDQANKRLSSHLLSHGLNLNNIEPILNLVMNEIFKKQGLDFSNFLLKGETTKTLETELENIIAGGLENADIPGPNKGTVGLAVLATIRDILYRGSYEELEYLRRLSRSYLMLFLMKCDPKVCGYFDQLASNLRVFVCNSIIVPALSEIALPKNNRRHWNLLASASQAQVELIINKSTLDELVNHLHGVYRIYQDEYEGLESFYSEETTLRYVDQIFIRAYLYERSNDELLKFRDFYNKIVTPNQSKANTATELRIFLAEELGIKYKEDAALGVQLKSDEVERLSMALSKSKRSQYQARSDAETILSIYALRNIGNEAGSTGAFGYKTWWLSKDTTTHRAVEECFKDRTQVSCYLRPDFLLHYITLSANFRQSNRVFDKMFPTLVGISISHHVSEDVSHAVQSAIAKHKELSPTRVRAVVGTMTTKLMTHELKSKKSELIHFLDDKLNIV